MTEIIQLSAQQRHEKSKRSEKPQSDMDYLIDGLFQVLPAQSRTEIARKLSKQTGRRIPPASVGGILTHLRKNSQRYGWTVPLAQLGRQAKAERGQPRFFHVLVEKGRDPEFDLVHETQLNNGLVSTVSHAGSTLQHESDALFLAANYCLSPGARRWIKSLGRRMKQIAEDAAEMLEMLNENGGAA